MVGKDVQVCHFVSWIIGLVVFAIEATVFLLNAIMDHREDIYIKVFSEKRKF